MRITLLTEGSTPAQRMFRRWGVSFLIGRFLFDGFGRADVFARNARKYGVVAQDLQMAAISHDHWDHYAGFPELLRIRPGLRVAVCRNSSHEFRGMLAREGAELVLIDEPQLLVPGIHTLGQLPGKFKNEVLYEQALALDTDPGVCVITGCAHPGILPILRRAQSYLGKPVHTVCGGFHLKNSTPAQIDAVGEGLRQAGVKRVIPLHCTGASAVSRLRELFADDCLLKREGESWRWDGEPVSIGVRVGTG